MIKAIIFDMDGVIADTQVIHSMVESEILRREGVNICPDEISEKYAGVSTGDFFKELLKEKRVAGKIENLLDEKWQKMSEICGSGVKEICGAINFIEQAGRRGYKLAVASASKKVFISAVLEKLNIKNKFDAIVSSEEVAMGKPSPDIFLLAAKKLSVVPKDCLVIEDGIIGMEGAKRAGMKCVGLTRKKECPADIAVETFKEVDFNYIKSL